MRALLALLLGFSGSARAATGPDMALRPETEAMRPYSPPPRQSWTLPNGLKVIFIPERRFPLVTLRLAAPGLASALSSGEAGFGEALAELLLAGTSRRDAKAIAYEADALGGGVSASAYADYVLLSAFALSENAERLIALAAELAADSTFPEDEVALRKTNMLEELRVQRGQPAFLARVAFAKRFYGAHPYARVAPTEASIAALSRDRLLGLHRRLFSPENAVLVVAGDVGRGDLERFVSARFGPWRPSGAGTLSPAPPPSASEALKRRVAALERPESVQLEFRLGLPAPPEVHPDYIPLLVANQILGGSFAARLSADLREKKGYTYGIYSSLDLGVSGGAFMIKSRFRNEVAAAAISETLEHLRRLRMEPVGDAELRQAKNMLAGRFVRGFETQDGLIDGVLHGALHDLPADHLETYVGRVQAVTAEQVRAAARAYMDPDKALIAVVGEAETARALSGLSQEPPIKLDEDGEILP